MIRKKVLVDSLRQLSHERRLLIAMSLAGGHDPVVTNGQIYDKTTQRG